MNSSISNNSVEHITQFSCKKHVYFMLLSLIEQFYFKQFNLVEE